jgi:hypothetical protein
MSCSTSEDPFMVLTRIQALLFVCSQKSSIMVDLDLNLRKPLSHEGIHRYPWEQNDVEQHHITELVEIHYHNQAVLVAMTGIV